MADGQVEKNVKPEEEVILDDSDFPGEDPDDLELAEALKELKAENGDEGDGETDDGASPGEEDQGATPADGEASPEKTETSEGAEETGKKGEEKPETPMIPKARLDEVLRERDLAAQGIAYWQGKAEAAQELANKGATPSESAAPPQLTFEQQVDAIQEQRLALAEKFDDGGISMVELRKDEFALAKHERALMDAMSAHNNPPAQPAPSAESLYLAEKTDKLLEDHPYSGMIEKPEDWEYLERLARQNLGDSIGTGDLATYKLRKEIASLTDRYGPVMTGKELQIHQPNDGKPATVDASNDAAQRRKKLELAGTQPPDINAIGNSGQSVPGELSDSNIEGMTEDEIAALPETAKAKIRGTSW